MTNRIAAAAVLALWPLHALAQSQPSDAEWDRMKTIAMTVGFTTPAAMACGLPYKPMNDAFVAYVKGLDIPADRRKQLGDLAIQGMGVSAGLEKGAAPSADQCQKVKALMVKALNLMASQ